MTILSSRMLEHVKRVGETATAIDLRQAGENSALASLPRNSGKNLFFFPGACGGFMLPAK